MDRMGNKNQSSFDWSRLRERLIYLPGGLILLYGLWLTLTV